MQDFKIDVTKIEELQTIKNIEELDRIFYKAHQIITGGAAVLLIRKYADGRTEKFDTLTTDQDLKAYRETVYKYL
jgi:hypothetical protein